MRGYGTPFDRTTGTVDGTSTFDRLLVVEDEQIEVGHRSDGLHDLGQADEPAPERRPRHVVGHQQRPHGARPRDLTWSRRRSGNAVSSATVPRATTIVLHAHPGGSTTGAAGRASVPTPPGRQS